MGTPVNQAFDAVAFALGTSDRVDDPELSLTPEQSARILKAVLKKLQPSFKYYDFEVGVKHNGMEGFESRSKPRKRESH